jgi:hypothetical protein
LRGASLALTFGEFASASPVFFGAALRTTVLLPEPICYVTDPLFFVVHVCPADEGDGKAVGKPTHQRKTGSLVPP